MLKFTRLLLVTAIASGIGSTVLQAQTPEQDRIRNEVQQQERIYGASMMTEQERNEYREKMRSMATEEERAALREQHREEMLDRARAQGKAPPEESGGSGQRKQSQSDRGAYGDRNATGDRKSGGGKGPH